MKWKIEYLPLIVNIACLIYYGQHKPTEPGKILYWIGAILLTIGLIKMRG